MIDQELIDRVRSGEGADRKLDIMICLAARSAKDHPAYWNWQALRSRDEPQKPDVQFWKQFAPAYTTDLNAVLALIAEKLPGAETRATLTGTAPYSAYLAVIPAHAVFSTIHVAASSPCRALLAVVLMALLARNAKDDAE